MKFRVSTPAVDLPILVTTLLASTWLALHTDLQIESALGLVSTKWLADMDESNAMWRQVNSKDQKYPFNLSPREQYARKFPRSPISLVNRIPGIFEVEKAIDKGVDQAMPSLAVMAVGFGLVAVRRPGSRRTRARWGPGRVAAAVGMIISSASILVEFALRRLDLMKHGWYHDSMVNSFLTNAQTVGVAILAAWLLLAVSGRWRPPKGRRDGLGLALGVLWLLALAWIAVLAPMAQL